MALSAVIKKEVVVGDLLMISDTLFIVSEIRGLRTHTVVLTPVAGELDCDLECSCYELGNYLLSTGNGIMDGEYWGITKKELKEIEKRRNEYDNTAFNVALTRVNEMDKVLSNIYKCPDCGKTFSEAIIRCNHCGGTNIVTHTLQKDKCIICDNRHVCGEEFEFNCMQNDYSNFSYEKRW